MRLFHALRGWHAEYCCEVLTYVGLCDECFYIVKPVLIILDTNIAPVLALLWFLNQFYWFNDSLGVHY